jgi:hypothetical protein
MSILSRSRALAALALAPTLALAACDAPGTDPTRVTYQAAVVVNSVGRSLTVIPTDNVGQVTTIPLGASGSPVSLAVRGSSAVVPMGTYPFAAVANVATGATAFAALPANSGATGAAFANDSIAVVANSDRNTVSPVNVNTRVVGAEIPVGVYPQAVVSTAERVFVINANLVNFAPAGHGSVTVLNSSLTPVGTVQLTGDNPAAGVVIGDKLYVLNSGHFGKADGTLSVVDIPTLKETKLATGFGEFPGSLAPAADGRLFVGVYGSGILVYNPSSGNFDRGPANPLVPTGSKTFSALAVDQLGRLYSADPGECSAPGKLFRVTSETEINQTVPTGVCPFAVAIARITVDARDL